MCSEVLKSLDQNVGETIEQYLMFRFSKYVDDIQYYREKHPKIKIQLKGARMILSDVDPLNLCSMMFAWSSYV